MGKVDKWDISGAKREKLGISWESGQVWHKPGKRREVRHKLSKTGKIWHKLGKVDKSYLYDPGITSVMPMAGGCLKNTL